MKYNEVVELVDRILADYNEATVRQIYYRLVSPPYQYLENTQSMYTSFDKMLVKARECGDIDWHRIVDRSRRVIAAPNGYPSPGAFLDKFKDILGTYHQSYTIDLWESQNCELKIFVEKDALSEILAAEAEPYQVDVVPGKGYNSFTQLAQQASELEDIEIDKSIIILYFGDFDPSGLDIDHSAGQRLAEYSGREIHFERMALTPADVIGLPSNPTKLADPRARAYVEQHGNACWELDALPPDELRARVRASTESYIDVSQWNEDRARLGRERRQVQAELARVLDIFGRA